ncbi:MAG: nucleotidyltransferase [Lachnospiraceae bacterium]|nr:nucleotidyltransferase [Lachnospiraceae bacterium]
MKETALVIMAAGIGSRFGGGIKQLAKLGPHEEIIIDYSIHDALKAGFDKIIFIIRKDIEADFKEVIGDRISRIAKVRYAFQDLSDLPEGFTVPEGRKKPWGTGQAILAARDLIDCPFIVINADDFYGAEGFKKVHDYLVNEMDENSDRLDLCMAGYVLGNTLSENGAVTRGVCEKDETGHLVSVHETFDIEKKDGVVKGKTETGEEVLLTEDAVASMNMWGLTPAFVKKLGEGFPEFLKKSEGNIKAEYLLPEVVGDLVTEGKATVKVLHTDDKWFGVTYADDKPYVMAALKELHEKKVYGDKLFD